MFKETYKEACDEIKGDKKAILDKAFKKASTVGSHEKKENHVIKFSVIGTAAAAAIIIVAVTLNIDLFKPSPEKYDFGYDMAETSAEESAEGVFATSDALLSEVTEVTDEEETTAAKPEKMEKKESVGRGNSASAPTEPRETETKAAKTVPEESGANYYAGRKYEETAPEEFTSEEELPPVSSTGFSRARSGSGGGNSLYSSFDEDDEAELYSDSDDSGFSGYAEKTMTYDEYAQYVGFDAAAIKLPDDVPKIEKTPCTVAVDENGEIVDDTVVFGEEIPGRCVTFTVGHSVDAAWAIDDGKKTSSVTAELGEERRGTIYASVGEVYVIAECVNLTDAEVANIEIQLDTYGK